MLKRILVPLDGSDASAAALDYASSLPTSEIELLATVEEPDGLTQFMSAADRETWQLAAEKTALDYLAGKAATLGDRNTTVRTTVLFGDPAERIVDASHDADLIVMTTHGYGSGRRLVYGSVADRVARHAASPVLMLRGGDHPLNTEPINRIVIALDGSPLSEQALAFAEDLARDLGASMLLIRVLDAEAVQAAVHAGGSPIASYAESAETVGHAMVGYLAEHAARLRDEGIPTAIEVPTGDPAHEILATGKPGDLIVMTSHGRGGIGRWLLGSVAEKLVRQARAPVLLMRSRETV